MRKIDPPATVGNNNSNRKTMDNKLETVLANSHTLLKLVVRM